MNLRCSIRRSPILVTRLISVSSRPMWFGYGCVRREFCLFAAFFFPLFGLHVVNRNPGGFLFINWCHTFHNFRYLLMQISRRNRNTLFFIGVLKFVINRAAMGRARFIIYPWFIYLFFNRAAMGRARFIIYPWFIFIFFFFRVERPRSPLGRTKDSRESRNQRCLFAKSF